ncbi:MAG: sigma-70 family RNA polymerase sigma factor [Oscillospiraceae bacterium]|nr:sigma-70 family RNA polymerase sigma factor [Oscillospiraceae bacterium]
MFSIEDIELIRLYQGGSEDAIEASERKYGAYCRKIAMNVLGDAEDAGECVNDVWLKAWNGIPHAVPPNLQAYFAKLTRELAIDRRRRSHSAKRGGGELPLCLDELSECLPAKNDVEAAMEQKELALILRQFLSTLDTTRKNVFLCRYWYFDTEPEIAKRFGFSRVKVASMLHRTRKQLKSYLKERGYSDEKL